MSGLAQNLGRLKGLFPCLPGLTSGAGGGGLVPPTGFVFLIDNDGAYLVDSDGAYLVEAI
jgi:hypothetical protein